MKDAAQILLVEDDPDARLLVQQWLESAGFRVTAASGGELALAHLRQAPIDLVVSDVTMPGGGGLELVTQARQLGLVDLPIILMSGQHDVDRRISALDLGADDFIAKPVERRELIARVRAQMRRARRQAELARASTIEPATGVLNRRGLERAFARESARMLRHGGFLSLLMLDVGGFALVIDRYGHAVGDAMLVQVGRALAAAVRATDYVGRLSRDAFVVMMPDADREAAEISACRLRALAVEVEVAPNRAIGVEMSIARVTAGAGDTFERLLAAAVSTVRGDDRTSVVPR